MTDTPAILDTSHHQRDQRTSPTRAFRWACISGLGLFCAPVLVLALSGCGEDRDVIFSTTPAVTA
jgi:hypothetical protein